MEILFTGPPVSYCLQTCFDLMRRNPSEMGGHDESVLGLKLTLAIDKYRRLYLNPDLALERLGIRINLDLEQSERTSGGGMQ
ncbi:hypothetical protein B842_05170 [Corynebacterium humireducens NBRC 106098 = DSM 45392]|uniref:Uncharacterized protein n=1 Tax=Corynebacterium humireducens NBRC 106098 = DSM 45392 TaxID=1223515 RepID=A0A0B5D211_9CORY|nr:hypothetical protein B842_05170 [Corynebacterium humireducens NBRC 106098 = DSM 45392]